jgi:hypothetical protein
MSHRRKHRIKLKSLYVWHRYAGLCAALLVIVLAVTGVALNHTEGLKLDEHFVRSAWIQDWYGIRAPEAATSFATPAASVTLLGRRLYVGGRPLPGEYERLVGAVSTAEMLIAAVDDRLLLIGPQGDLLAELSHLDGVPPDVQRLGMDGESRPVIATESGHYRPDANFTRWERLPEARDDIVWARPATLPPDRRAELERNFRARVLPWERVLLDVHSGRFFGAYGVWIMDGAALLLCFLAGSGVLIWLKRKR